MKRIRLTCLASRQVDWPLTIIGAVLTALLNAFGLPWLLLNTYNHDYYWDANSGRIEVRHVIFRHVTKVEPAESSLGGLYLEYVGTYPAGTEWHLDKSRYGLGWPRVTDGHGEYGRVANAGRLLADELTKATCLDADTKRWLIVNFLEAARRQNPGLAESYGWKLASLLGELQSTGQGKVSPDDFPSPAEYESWYQ